MAQNVLDQDHVPVLGNVEWSTTSKSVARAPQSVHYIIAPCLRLDMSGRGHARYSHYSGTASEPVPALLRPKTAATSAALVYGLENLREGVGSYAAINTPTVNFFRLWIESKFSTHSATIYKLAIHSATSSIRMS